MEFYEEYLKEVRAQALYREPVSIKHLDAVHIQVEGKNYLSLSSNNYLGLTHNPKVQKAALDAVLQHGTGSGGARLTTGSHPLHKSLERELAQFKGTEAALVFNTGYMANVGTISALVGKGDLIFSDELNHASIIDGCRLSKGQTVVYRHADMKDLAEKLRNSICPGKRLIVTDGVFSMDGDIAPLDKIVPLAEEYQAIVMVDDAHAVGVLGRGGRGTVDYFGLKGRVDVQVGTLSKSLASEGGYVAGSQMLIQYLVNKARSFIFSTALSPATVAAAASALKVLKATPQLVDKLLENAAGMRKALVAAGLKVDGGLTPIIPILVGEAALAVAMNQELKEHGLLVSAIRPPTVSPGASRLRITVSAAHEKEELAKAADSIIAVSRKLNLI
ncbi:8-amino-7-oxononanoate synthase [Pelosinus sp. UFO1]|uniref:8-amino-7-oxononanoate synthase n=1 Tax=Pelosinus sp. UFO1 TaxID=484770 RepID=UPI0004D18252|nr:8-amino-7-oxononanoate synthase [Pelosinus sp. UFO1]AIF53595.1 8-amino-7-oxononanoate synthase [Pelosinus sp. UFO1]